MRRQAPATRSTSPSRALGCRRLSPPLSLPAITASVLIDGFSQPGYAGTPLIELSGQSAPRGDGLTITGSGVTVRGLAINGFASGAGILIVGPDASGNAIEANVIGTDPTGSQARPNNFGVKIVDGAHDNIVGGTDATAGNLIAFNSGQGVVVQGNGSIGNRINANRIFANNLGHGGIDFDGGLLFDGSGSYVQAAVLSPRVARLTVEAWVKSDNVAANWARVIDFGDGPGVNNIFLAWADETGQMQWSVADQNGDVPLDHHGRRISPGRVGPRRRHHRRPGQRGDLLERPAGRQRADGFTSRRGLAPTSMWAGATGTRTPPSPVRWTS